MAPPGGRPCRHGTAGAAQCSRARHGTAQQAQQAHHDDGHPVAVVLRAPRAPHHLQYICDGVVHVSPAVQCRGQVRQCKGRAVGGHSYWVRQQRMTGQPDWAIVAALLPSLPNRLYSLGGCIVEFSAFNDNQVGRGVDAPGQRGGGHQHLRGWARRGVARQVTGRQEGGREEGKGYQQTDRAYGWVGGWAPI